MTITETPRLTIRTYTLEDVEDCFDIYSRKEVAEWLHAEPTPNLDVQREYLSNRIATYQDKYNSELGFYAMELKETGKVIGSIMLKHLPDDEKVEIGWHLNPDYWGKGYVTEAAEALLEYGFEKRGLDTVYAITLQDNTRSQAVCKRIGMVYEGLTDRYHNLTLSFFSISATDWRTRKNLS